MLERPAEASRAWRALLLAVSPIFVLAALGVTAADPEAGRLDDHHRFAAPVVVDNLTVWPIVTDRPIATARYVSLERAQKEGKAVIRERDGDASVEALVIENRGDEPIYVPGGTILKGGKQDRQIGVDLVVLPGTSVEAQAYCVEQGRWSMAREGRATGGRFEIPKAMAAKRARASALYEKNQNSVWEQVSAINRAADQAPETSTLLATLEQDEPKTRAARAKTRETVREHLMAEADVGEVVGFAYAIDAEPIAVRVFANRAMLDEHLAPFLETMSIEAGVARRRDLAAGRAVHQKAAPIEAVVALVRGIDRAPEEAVTSLAANRIQRRTNDWGGHQVCSVAESGDWVALAQDWTAPAEVEGELRETLRALDALGYVD